MENEPKVVHEVQRKKVKKVHVHQSKAGKKVQSLDLAVRKKWNPEKKTIKNVTKSETKVGCVTFDSAPLQASHVQPRKKTKKKKKIQIIKKRYHDPRACKTIPLAIGVYACGV